MKTLKLTDNRLLVRIKKVSYDKSGKIETKQRIIIPEDVANRECEVLAVGPGFRDQRGKRGPLLAKKGDVVLIDNKTLETMGVSVFINNERLTIVRETDILGVLVEEEVEEKIEVATLGAA